MTTTPEQSRGTAAAGHRSHLRDRTGGRAAAGALRRRGSRPRPRWRPGGRGRRGDRRGWRHGELCRRRSRPTPPPCGSSPRTSATLTSSSTTLASPCSPPTADVAGGGVRHDVRQQRPRHRSCSSRAFAPAMAERGRGSIISLSSMAGRRRTSPEARRTAQPKPSLEAMTRAWAAEYSPRGVRVNAHRPWPWSIRRRPSGAAFITALGETTPMHRALTARGDRRGHRLPRVTSRQLHHRRDDRRRRRATRGVGTAPRGPRRARRGLRYGTASTANHRSPSRQQRDTTTPARRTGRNRRGRHLRPRKPVADRRRGLQTRHRLDRVGERARPARRATSPSGVSSSATRDSSRAGLPPMPMLPSSSSALRHRPRPAPHRRSIRQSR